MAIFQVANSHRQLVATFVIHCRAYEEHFHHHRQFYQKVCFRGSPVAKDSGDSIPILHPSHSLNIHMAEMESESKFFQYIQLSYLSFTIYRLTYLLRGLSWWLNGLKEKTNPPAMLELQEMRFDPWVRKILWKRIWQPTSVFLSGESHGQRSLAGYSPQGCKESDTTERLSMPA